MLGGAGPAVASNLQSCSLHLKSFVQRHVLLEPLEHAVFDLGDLAAAVAGQMKVFRAGAGFKIMHLAMQMHQVKLIDEALLLQKLERAVNGGPVDIDLLLRSLAQSACIQVRIRLIENFKKDTALTCHSNSGRGQFCAEAAMHSFIPVDLSCAYLRMSRNFGAKFFLLPHDYHLICNEVFRQWSFSQNGLDRVCFSW